MNKERMMVENREIDLVDFFKSILEQWRGWLVLGIAFGAFVMGVMYFKQAQPQPDLPSEMRNYFGGEKLRSTDVAMTLSYFCLWKQCADYENQSPIMILDGGNVRKLTVNLYISEEDIDISSLYDYYTNRLFDEQFLKSLADAYGYEGDYGYLADMVSFSGESALTIKTTLNTEVMFDGFSEPSNLLSIVVLLPNEVDEHAVENSICSYFSDKSREASFVFGDHDVVFLSSELTTVPDQTITGKQATVIKNCNDFRTSFNSFYNVLDSASKTEVDDIIDKLIEGKINYSDVKATYPMQMVEIYSLPTSNVSDNTSSFNPKYAIIGFAIGAFIYIGMAFVFLILNRRFRGGDEVAESLSLRSYGDIYEYPYSGVGAFLHDRRIYKWRHKNGISSDEVAKAVLSKAKFSSLDNLTCLVIGDSSGFAEKNIEKIKTYVSGNGVNLILKNAPNGLASFSEDEISNFAPVLITIVSECTKPNYVVEIISRLKEYQIPVFGVNYIEGPKK